MITNRTLERMREAADSGMSKAAAARELGVSWNVVWWWDRREGLGFQHPTLCMYRPTHPVHADLAMARLAATWARLCDAAAGRRP